MMFGVSCENSSTKKPPKEYSLGVSPEVEQLDEEIEVLQNKLHRHMHNAHKEELGAQQDFLVEWGNFSDKMEEREEEEFKVEKIEKQIQHLKERREILLNQK